MNLPNIANSHFRYYAAAAQELGISWREVLPGYVMELQKGGERYYLYRAATPLNRQSHVRIAKSKWTVAEMLRPYDLSVPVQAQIHDLPELQAFYKEHKAIVVKPTNSHGGKGISILPGEADLQGALEYAFRARENEYVLAEPYYRGNNYRLLTLDGEMLAGVWRKVPSVVGNGVATVDQLVEQFNKTRKRRNASPISQDAEYEHTLSLFKLTRNSVIPQGEVQPVRLTANISKGGTTVDVTERVHPVFKELARKVSDILQLRLVAVDLITSDIGVAGTYVINEVNVSPGLRIHYQPSEGAIQPVAVPILKALFNLK